MGCEYGMQGLAPGADSARVVWQNVEMLDLTPHVDRLGGEGDLNVVLVERFVNQFGHFQLFVELHTVIVYPDAGGHVEREVAHVQE